MSGIRTGNPTHIRRDIVYSLAVKLRAGWKPRGDRSSVLSSNTKLNEQEVQARTETTLKMANVAGTSAQTVSDQMTAVWNNFYDGSKSLEYYSDVMVKLGAATASSTDEISEGVNKFAATAKTVGLSYEYATAALATVTARTRESADTVGNAFKTLFSRIQGLNLGETLDDGTTLNKYSKALAAVGIDIKDQSGELKEMDTILDEMGSKWGTLAEAEKMALAQTVGGARQYTQLMALLENWDYFKENLDVAYNSEGALEEQQQIYAESWDAAADRVQASIEGVYQAILDDKFFIKLNNGFANALGGLEAFIEGAGGVKTIITGIGSVMLGVFANKIPDALQTVRYNFDLLTKGSEAAYDRIQKQMKEASDKAFAQYNSTTGGTGGIDANSSTGLEVQYANDLLAAKNKLALVSDKMSAAEEQQYKVQMSLIEAHQKETVALQKQAEALELEIELQKEAILLDNTKEYKPQFEENDKISNRLSEQQSFYEKAAKRNGKNQKQNDSKAKGYQQADSYYEDALSSMSDFANKLNEQYEHISQIITKGIANGEYTQIRGEDLFSNDVFNKLAELRTSLEKITNSNIDESDKLTIIKSFVKDLSASIPAAVQQATGLDKILTKMGRSKSVSGLVKDFDELNQNMTNAVIEGKDYERVIKAFKDHKDINKLIQDLAKLKSTTDKATKSKKEVDALMQSFRPEPIVQGTQALAAFASGLGSISSVFNSVQSVFTTLQNPDLSGWEKLSSVMSSTMMTITGVRNAFQQYGQVISWINSQTAALGVVTAAANTTQQATAVINGLLSVQKEHILGVLTKEQALQLAATALQLKEQGLDEAQIATKLLQTTVLQGVTDAKEAEIIAQTLGVAVTDLENASLQKLIITMMQLPIFWIIAGITAIASVIGYLVNKQKEMAEQSRENAKASREAASEKAQEVNDTQELVLSYNELIASYDDLSERMSNGESVAEEFADIQEQLKKKALEVAEALGLEGAAINVLAEDYDALSDSVNEAQKHKIQEAKQAEERASNDTLQEFYWDSREEAGHVYDVFGSGNYVARYDGVLGGLFNDLYDEGWLGQSSSYDKYEHISLSKTIFDTGNLKLETGNTAEDIIALYEEVQSLYDEAGDNMTSEQTATSEFYKWLGDWLAKSKDSYEAYVASQEKIEEYQIDEAALTSYGGVKNASAIKSQEEYDTYTSEMVKSIAKERGYLDENNNIIAEHADEYKELTTAVHAYLGAIDGLSDFSIKSLGFEEISSKTTKARNEIESFYNSLSDEEKEIFFDIDFDHAKTEEQWKKELERLQAIANGEAIIVQYQWVESGKALLGNEDATEEDWDNWANNSPNEDFNYNDFKYYSSDKKAQYLNSLSEPGDYWKGLTQQQEAYGQYLEDINGQLANNAQEAQEAYRWLSEKQAFIDSGGTLTSEEETQWNDYEKIADDYTLLMQNATNAADAIKSINDEIQKANSLDSEYLSEEWESQFLKDAQNLDLDVDEITDFADAIEELAENSDEVDERLKDDRKALLDFSKSAKQTQKGLKALADNFDDWKEALQSKDILKQNEAWSEMSDALADVLNMSDEMAETGIKFGDTFKNYVLNNLDQVQKAANGDKEAIMALQEVAAQDFILQLGLDEATTSQALSELSNVMSLMQSQIDSQELKIGTPILETGPLLESLNNMINSMGLSVQQAQQLLADLGFDAKVTEVPSPSQTITRNFETATVSGWDQYGYPTGLKVVSQQTVDTVDAGTMGTALEITSGTYTGGGNISGATGGTGNYKPSSGGGGSSKEVKFAEKKNDSDKTRYHTLINQLEDLSAEYDDISKAKDRAFGKDKLKNIDAEIEKTDELIDKQQEYLDAIAADLPVDKAVMDAYYQDVIGGPAIEYDERGNIANYDAIQDAMFAKYNAMADAYDEDSTEWQVFEEKYEQLEKYIEQYEETYDLLRDEEQEYQDLLNQRIDLQLEKVQYTVELKLNVSEDQVKLLEYQLGKVEDDGFKSLEAIGLLTAKAGELNNQIQANKQGLNDALKLSLSAAEISEVMAGNMDVLNGKNFTEDQIEAIRDYRDELLDLNEQLDEIRESVEEKLMEAFDAWQEKLEKGIDTIDHYGSVLESYKNIIDIVGTDTLGLSDEFMNNLSQGSVDNAINKLEAAKAEYHAVESARAEAEKKLDEARASGDTKSAEMWESTLEDLTEKSQEAQENMLSAWEDALSKVAEQFEQSVERIVDNFNKSVYKLGGLEGLSNDFAKEQERSDMMLDDYEKIYELSKLSRDINKSIDDTDLIGGKQKLKKLLGEVNALQEDGVEMSQYDLEYLQKTYDLRLAELELEEAQRAKNTVRLSKDNEGNWSYVYTQNTDAVDAAQQKYEDALYAMQDLSSNYIDEMSEKLIETSQEMAEALAELRVEDFASIDEYYAEVDRVQKYYQEQMDFQEEELNKAIANNKTLYEEDWTAYHEATGYKISDTEDFVTKFSDSMLGGLMDSDSLSANFTDLIAGSTGAMVEQLLAAANTYYENMANAMEAADTSIESFGEDIGASVDEVVAKSDEGATAVEDMADRMNTAVNDVMSNIQTWQQTYGAMMDQIVNDNLKVIESINDLVAALSLDDFDASVSWSFTPKNSSEEEGSSFDTGGYTGSWGKEGKLAVLHEKELVLNANDTANMLDALRLTQELLEMIDLQAQTAKLGFGNLVATTLKDSQRETLEQKVEITAEFPNVTDHNEIEEALMNLTNTASQYANRKG